MLSFGCRTVHSSHWSNFSPKVMIRAIIPKTSFMEKAVQHWKCCPGKQGIPHPWKCSKPCGCDGLVMNLMAVVVDGWTWSWRCFPGSAIPWLHQSDPGGSSQIQPRNRPSTGGLGCEATDVSWFSGSSLVPGRFMGTPFWLGCERQTFTPNKFPCTNRAIPEPRHQPQSKELPKNLSKTPQAGDSPLPSSAILLGSSCWRSRDCCCPQQWQLWPAGSSDTISRRFPTVLWFPRIPVSARAIGLRS